MKFSEKRLASCQKVMQVLFSERKISRAEIARRCSLSKQTASETVSLLEQSGLVKAGQFSQGNVGRASQDFVLASDAAYALAFDVGGTKILGVLVSMDGSIVAAKKVPTPIEGGMHVVESLAALSADLFFIAKADPTNLKAITLGVPGVPDRATGCVRLASNIKGWDDFDLTTALEQTFGDCEIRMENDVKIAAIGEKQYPRDEQWQSFGFLNIGTGICLGAVLDGEIVRGASGAAGEIGFLPIVPSGDTGPRPQFELLEEAYGSKGLLARYNKASQEDAEDVREIFQRASDGEELALSIIDDATYYLSVAIRCVKASIDLEHFILGGSIGMQDLFIEKLRANLDVQGETSIILTKSLLDNKAGICGAAYLAAQTVADELLDFSSSGQKLPEFSITPDDIGDVF